MWNRALFWTILTGPVGLRNCVLSQSSIRPNVNVWWSPSSLVLCTTLKLPTFYLANLKLHPFFEDLGGPVAPQGFIKSKSLIIQNILWIWFCGGPFCKKYPNFDFWFSPLLGPLGVRRIKKLHKTESDRRPILGGPFYKKYQNSKILVGPPASPALLLRFLRPRPKTQKSAPNVLFALLSGFRKGPTWPPCPKTPGVDRLGRNLLFRGPGWPQTYSCPPVCLSACPPWGIPCLLSTD